MSGSITLKKEEAIQWSAKRIPILFVGHSSAGKTSLVTRLYIDKFPDSLKATLGMSDYVIGATINGEDYRVVLYDTAGQERLIAYRPVISVWAVVL